MFIGLSFLSIREAKDDFAVSQRHCRIKCFSISKSNDLSMGAESHERLSVQ